MKSKILIIEDDFALAGNLIELLEEEGFSVTHANNGESGIAKAKQVIPDLIICDIMMPIKNGYDVKSELNNSENTFDIPFIFLTAKTEIAEMRKGMNLGAEDYLYKPYKATELLNIVNARIEKSIRSKKKIITGISSTNEPTQKTIKITIGNELKIIKTDSISAFFASNQYSIMLKSDGKSILLRKSLSEWENELPNNTFIRIHRATIINKNFIKEMRKNESGAYYISLKSYGERLPVSRSNFSKLKSLI